jgi:hypothetical protein
MTLKIGLGYALRGGVLVVGPDPLWPGLQSGHEGHRFLQPLLMVLTDGGEAQRRLTLGMEIKPADRLISHFRSAKSGGRLHR